MKKLKEVKGITLISLIVTIIILLILAGISIATLTGYNGILGQAGKAKEKTEIAGEKEIIELAVISAMEKSVYGQLDEEILQKEIDKLAGKGKTELYNTVGNFEVYFKKSNRYYEIDAEGNIGEDQIAIEISNAGDITKGGTLDGSEEKPYEISCIEDLVELSKNAVKYNGKNYKLMRNLNFKSRFSYYDSNSTAYGDINENESIETLMVELTTEKGFLPIMEGSNNPFNGSFDGQGYEISNLLIKRKWAGLFKEVSSFNLKNLGITGNIEGVDNAGGIIARSVKEYPVIENCYFKGNVKATTNAGGIIGQGIVKSINNCFAEGIIESEKYAGGISGTITSSITEIKNCYNRSTVYGKEISGGIIGQTNYSPQVYNCFNAGKVKSDSKAGGIVGNIYAAMKIKNVYNIGHVECTTNKIGAIVGGALWNNPETLIENSFYLEGTATKETTTVTDKTKVYKKKKMKSEDFVKELNDYIDNNADVTEGWLKWKIGENGYPVFK